MIQRTYKNYKHYGKCLSLSNGTIELLVTVEVGPRIIFFGLKDGENIMYEDKDDLINKDGAFFEENLPDQGIWHIYGGHRLWKSPEYMDTYYPDNAPVEVTELPDGAIFVSKPELTTHLQKSMRITMTPSGEVTVTHEFLNCGAQTTPAIALWGLSVLDKGACASIPLSTEDTGFLPNRNVVLWPYTDLKDDRLQLKQDEITLTWKNVAAPIKVGALVHAPIAVHTKGLEFTIACDLIPADYPDWQCNVESYTNEIMLEIETLSPLYRLAPGERKSHVERWTLRKL